MPVGTCKLCLREHQELQDSHLIPAGLYRRILSRNDASPHPVLITERGSHESSKQVRDYVLCADCEALFDSKGENYALRMVTARERFRLLEELEAVKPSFEKLDWRGYNVADTPGIKRDDLAYFALSVFWRASVHTWPSAEKGGKAVRINLGRENNEALRLFLLNEGPIPSAMTLFFVVCTDRLSQGSFYMPTLSHKKDFSWTYGFAACGYFFCLNVGKRLGRESRQICFVNSPEQWIWVRDGEAKTIEGYTSLIMRQPLNRGWPEPS